MSKTYGELIKRLRSHDGWALNQTLDEAADAIEELTAELEYTKRQYDLAMEDLEKIGWGKWIPVTERLPSREGKYLTAFSKGEVGQNVFLIFRGSSTKWYFNSEDTGEVTHWMPLPEPPKGD